MADATTAEADDRTALECMLEARSVAVVGASVKEGSLGATMMVELRRGRYDGAVYPVNPAYDDVFGERCYASIIDLPEPIDLAILGVSNQRIEQAMLDAARAGARSVVTFSSLFEEAPSEPATSLSHRVAAIAREHGMALCGGNGMGFLNEEHHLRATGFATPDHLRHGPVAFVSHSGSAFAALAFNARGIGFNLLVSSGQEIVTTMDEYMAYALGRESTRVLALLLETVRAPAAFVSELARAAALQIPVVALMVGRTEGSKAMVTAHSGALAGEHGAYEAVFDAYGVHEVRTLDEMADTMELFSSSRRVTSGAGIASVHDSGGERALFVDLASDLDVPLAAISDTTRARIQDVLDPGLEASNPLDAWGTGIDADPIFREAFLALHDDPDVAALAFSVDLTRQGEPYDTGYLQVARDVWAATTKPFCVASNLATAVANEEASLIRDEGIPVLEGTDSALRSLRHLLDDRDVRARSPLETPQPVPASVRDGCRARLEETEGLSETAVLDLLRAYGISTVESASATSFDEAARVAERIGYPVVLKTAHPEIAHKSDVDGVLLGLAHRDDLRDAYRDLAARLGPAVTVAAMAPAGVEVVLGVVRDPTFGPLVLVGAGGVLVELLHDRRLALPPVDAARARRLVDRLAIRPLLDGARGTPPVDVAALAATVVRLSVLALDLGDLLDALDVNPVIVSPQGCVAVDALIARRHS